VPIGSAHAERRASRSAWAI